MDFDSMFSSFFDMFSFWKEYVAFFEFETEFMLHFFHDVVFIETTEDFTSDSRKLEWKLFSIEILRDIMPVSWERSEIFLAFLFFLFDIDDIFFAYFFCESFRDEIVTSLSSADFDDFSFASDICDSRKETYGEFIFI